jgi:hypothetical protein
MTDEKATEKAAEKAAATPTEGLVERPPGV